MTSSASRTTCAHDSSVPRRRRGTCRSISSTPTRSFAPSRSTSETATAVERVFATNRVDVVIHTAAQPSHDWAASDPQTDFGVNANGTLNLLEATRHHAPDATFIFTSTNKVYGDLPNYLPLDRARIAPGAARGPSLRRRDRHDDVDRPIDALALRRLQGRVRSARPGVRPLLRHEHGLLPLRLPHRPQSCRHSAPRVPVVPDALHHDRRRRTASAATAASRSATTSTAPTSSPPSPPSTTTRAARAVYNMGGGRVSNCSMLEAICAVRGDRRQRAELDARRSRRAWAITAGGSATSAPFQADYPDVVEIQHDVRAILEQIYAHQPRALGSSRLSRLVSRRTPRHEVTRGPSVADI